MLVTNIIYNNEILSSLSEGKTTTLECANQLFEHDLVIQVEESTLRFGEVYQSGNLIGFSVSGLLSANTKIIIPNLLNGKSVIKIEANTFKGSQIEEIYFGKNIVEIGANAFANCQDLVKIGFFGSQEDWDKIKEFVPSDIVVELL